MFNKLFCKNCICVDVSNTKLIKAFPTEYSESRLISKEILNGNAIVLDVSKTSKTDAVRMVDLLAGVLLAINGDYKRLAPMTFLLVPKKSMIDKYYKMLLDNQKGTQHDSSNTKDSKEPNIQPKNNPEK